MPGELRCGEYSFKLKMNPWQHPIFDNIHRLFALVSSLCRGCGGVVYLMADDAQTVTQNIFQVYQERLHALIDKNTETLSLLTNMVQISLLLGTHRSWAALLLKKSCDTLNQPPAEIAAICKPLTLDFALSGQIYIKYEPDSDLSVQIYTKPESHTHSESYWDMNKSVVSPVPGAASSAFSTYSQENNPLQTEPEPSPASGITPETFSGHSDDTAIPKMNFSSSQRLDWIENTKDWQKYVKIKAVKIDNII